VYGQHGNNTHNESHTPVPVTNLFMGVTAIAGLSTHSLAVKNGVAYAWGNNFAGQLGIGSITSITTPLAVVAALNSGVTAVSAMYQYSLAIKNGMVYGWGLNDSGH